ncbi:hypothetical protein [Ancylobacter lacus]|uniref:hypothetical protein n=1 Tax=Ancylobacter lacus TaxID=2579970 RepID=UPI001BCBD259|nr:hypothetical protein [Ancylobacter lacus]MBS7540150.1 hypothetical protein [Ancylobacter lacus]
MTRPMPIPRLPRAARCLMVLSVLLGVPVPFAAARADSLPDLSAVRRVEISGDAARLVLSAREGAPTGAQIVARRDGWFGGWYSSWFHEPCETASRLQVEGDVLRVVVSAPRFLWVRDCTVELHADLPAGVDVRIGLPAASARLEGRFGAVEVEAGAFDLELAGSAARARFAGDALRLRYDEALEATAGSVEVAGRAIDAALRFAGTAPLAWRVEARAAMVDATRPNEPAATRHVAVTGDYVHVEIR